MAAETGAITPSMLPADFNDRLLDEILLAPDADYPWARFAYAAAMQSQMQDVPGMDILMVQFKEGRLGGSGLMANMTEAMANGMGGPLMLSSIIYPDFIKIVSDPSKAREGETVKINRPRYLEGVYTEAARRIGGSTAYFGATGQPVTMDQATVTIYECAGPVDSNSAFSPINVGQYAATMSKHELIAYVGLLLRRDRTVYLNTLIETRLINAAAAVSGGITRPSGISVSADYTGAGQEPFSYDLIVRAIEALAGRKAPGIGGAKKYLAVLDQHQVADLKLDPMYQRLAQFHPQYNPLFPGYVSSVDNAIICETNSATRLSNLGGGGNITGYQGLVVAPEVLGWGCAMGCTPLRDRNDDGGRFNRFGWHAYEGWQVLQDFAQIIITD